MGAIALINTFETDLKKPVPSSALWEAPESQTLVQPHVELNPTAFPRCAASVRGSTERLGNSCVETMAGAPGEASAGAGAAWRGAGKACFLTDITALW